MAKGVKWKEYEYTTQMGPQGVLSQRPLISTEISWRGNEEKITVLSMIDSGTDSTVLHSDIARTLKIDLSRCQRVKLGGIGSAEGHRCNVFINVPGLDTVMDVPVIFLDNLPTDGLLGQAHFFQRFKVRFEKAKGKFYLATEL